jgi:anti-anti-sigma regulatory factor
VARRHREGLVHLVSRYAEGRVIEEVVHLDGVFDVSTAHALRSRLNATRADGAVVVVVDFSHVGAFEDFALAVLAQGLGPEAHDRVTLRGLCKRQERILRYFGIARLEPQSDVWTSR